MGKTASNGFPLDKWSIAYENNARGRHKIELNFS